MTYLFAIVLLLLAVWPVLAVLYLTTLTLLSGPAAATTPATRPWRFVVLVPAHNESANIRRTVANLQNLAWPQAHWQLVVIADNCNDDTATQARAGGALVWERNDPELRGKGYALQFGFARCLTMPELDAVVVVDADTITSPNLLTAFAARLEQGALAIQAYHGVANPNASWRTRLTAIAYGAFHRVRSRGRERLRLSAGLRGNGMCFRRSLLEQVPFTLNSLAEDLEYGAILGLAGVRVVYADEASADADIVAHAQGARGQRQRWEGGRWAVMRRYAPSLLRDAWQRRSAVSLELAAELLTLPLAQLVLQILLVIVAGFAIAPFWSGGWWAVSGGFVLLLLLAVHILRGWRLSGCDWRALLALAYVPFYIVWKLYALVIERGNREWRRTDRD